MDNIIIAGKKVGLHKPASDTIRNLWLGLLAEFELYQFAMNDRELLLHLQRRSLNGVSIKEIERISPYRYATLAKSAQQLVALGLAGFGTDSGRTKRLEFTIGNRIRGLCRHAVALSHP